MALPKITVMIAEGYAATRYIETGDGRSHLDRLIAGGVIREATDEDRERIRSRERVSMGHGSHWGSGEYVLAETETLYVLDEGFNLGHLELAIRRLHEQDRERKRTDLYARIDGGRCPMCGRQVAS